VTTVTYNLPKITHDLLVGAIAMKHLFPGQKNFIIIISPWLRDLEYLVMNFGVSFAQVLPSVEPNELATTKGILSKFLDLCCDGDYVHLITQKYGGAKIPKNDAKLNVEELEFLIEMSKKGTQIFLHEDLHAKIVCTAQGAMSGSANQTYQGYYGHSETVTYFSKKHSEYKNIWNSCQDKIKESIAYETKDLRDLLQAEQKKA